MKRRDVLKRASIGAVGTVSVLGSTAGTAAALTESVCYGTSGSPGAMNIYVYPNGSSSDGDKYDRAKQVCDDVAYDLYTYGQIPSACVHKRNHEAGVDVSFQGACDAMSDFSDWRKNNGYTERGCHLLVAYESWVDGCAVGSDGFTTDRSAIVEGPGDGDKFASVAAQETLHPFIHVRESCVQDLTNGRDDEHYLGATNANGEMTAIAKADKYVENGECNDSSWSGHTHEMTSCTREAVGCTYDNTT